MLRILLPLDGSKFADTALEFALRRLRRLAGECFLTGMAVLDTPGIEAREAGAALGASSFAKSAREHFTTEEEIRAEAILRHFESVCAEAGVPHIERSRAATPSEAIVAESAYHDLVILGQRNYFRFGHEGSEAALRTVIRDGFRPVIAVPSQLPESPECVLIAWDDSPPAARAVQLFCLMGIAAPKLVLVTVTDDTTTGEAQLSRIKRYTEAHGYQSEIVVASGSIDDNLLEIATTRNAGLIVMGAFAHRGLTSAIFGSTTTFLLDNGRLPVFLTV